MKNVCGRSCKAKQNSATTGIPGEIAVTRYTADATSTWLVIELLWTLHEPSIDEGHASDRWGEEDIQY